MKSHHSKVFAFVTLLALTAVTLFPPFASRGAGNGPAIDPYRSGVPALDVNATAAGLRKATSAQLAAIDQFKSN